MKKRKQKYSKYIINGTEEPLHVQAYHYSAPVERFLMLNKKEIPRANTFISIHKIDKLPKKVPRYCELHKHDHDEINILFSENDKLIYKIQIENEIYEVSSPSTVFIPKGTMHSAEVISGKGTYTCIILEGDYKASKRK